MSDQAEQTRSQGQPGSKFLRQCVSYMFEVQSANYFSPFSDQFCEFIHTSWFPELTHGMPAYDDQTWSWDFYENGNGDYNIGVDIGSDGEVTFRPGDDDGLYLQLKLKHPFEMGEVLELIRHLTPEKCELEKFQELPWSNMIQEVFVLVPGDKEQRLIKFSWSAWASQWPELLEPFRVKYYGQFKGRDDVLGLTWREWLERKSELESMPFAGELKEDDLLFSPNEGFQGARTALEGYELQRDLEPRLVIRLKPQQSRMYFLDFVEHTLEGEPLYSALNKDLENLPQLLKTRVKYPTTRLAQIRLGVELRVAKHTYEEMFVSLMQVREPADRLQEGYRLRTKNSQIFFSDNLQQIESLEHPLPFLIEWPLRRFQRADDRLLRIRFGQILLNILVKLPLFLTLEELSGRLECKPLIEPIERELFSKPASDGTLLKCLRNVQQFVSENGVPLPWFGQLVDRIQSDGDGRLIRIIEARNRFHHATHDERGLLQALDNEVPALIALFRQTLNGLIFVTPESQTYNNGQHEVVVRRLMGFESDFPRDRIVTAAPFESFPSGRIVVVNSKHDQALPLSFFFKSQPIQTLSTDVGVFDRMVDGHPEYVFILGQELL